jgi:preprotein translocase subunit SecD
MGRTNFFAGGHPISGLDPTALGAVYRGRAQFAAPTTRVSSGKVAKSQKEAMRRQTIAERKAALDTNSTTKGDG